MNASLTHRSGFPPLLIFILFILTLLILFSAGISMGLSHADFRHGDDAYYARECQRSWNLRMYNPETNRTGFICMTTSGKWGVWIADSAGNEVTAFLKNKFKNLEQVIRYMKNAGYDLLQ